MRSILPLCALAALATALLPACHKPRRVPPSPPPAVAGNTLSPGDFVTATGIRQQAPGPRASKINLTLTRPDEVQWVVETWSNSSGMISSIGNMKLKSPGDPWFAYMQETGRFWFFNGSDFLTHTITEDVINRGHRVIEEGRLNPGSPTPPAEVILRLPQNLRQLFPAVKPPEQRPSI